MRWFFFEALFLFKILCNCTRFVIVTLVKRREYPTRLTINNRQIEKIIIDPHYEEKHFSSVDDETIIALVIQLDGRVIEAEKQAGAYSYFATDKMVFEGKLYKLVWLLEDDAVYVGVVNCYRR